MILKALQSGVRLFNHPQFILSQSPLFLFIYEHLSSYLLNLPFSLSVHILIFRNKPLFSIYAYLAIYPYNPLHLLLSSLVVLQNQLQRNNNNRVTDIRIGRLQKSAYRILTTIEGLQNEELQLQSLFRIQTIEERLLQLYRVFYSATSFEKKEILKKEKLKVTFY